MAFNFFLMEAQMEIHIPKVMVWCIVSMEPYGWLIDLPHPQVLTLKYLNTTGDGIVSSSDKSPMEVESLVVQLTYSRDFKW